MLRFWCIFIKSLLCKKNLTVFVCIAAQVFTVVVALTASVVLLNSLMCRLEVTWKHCPVLRTRDMQ